MWILFTTCNSSVVRVHGWRVLTSKLAAIVSVPAQCQAIRVFGGVGWPSPRPADDHRHQDQRYHLWIKSTRYNNIVYGTCRDRTTWFKTRELKRNDDGANTILVSKTGLLLKTTNFMTGGDSPEENKTYAYKYNTALQRPVLRKREFDCTK